MIASSAVLLVSAGAVVWALFVVTPAPRCGWEQFLPLLLALAAAFIAEVLPGRGWRLSKHVDPKSLRNSLALVVAGVIAAGFNPAALALYYFTGSRLFALALVCLGLVEGFLAVRKTFRLKA